MKVYKTINIYRRLRRIWLHVYIGDESLQSYTTTETRFISLTESSVSLISLSRQSHWSHWVISLTDLTESLQSYTEWGWWISTDSSVSLMNLVSVVYIWDQLLQSYTETRFMSLTDLYSRISRRIRLQRWLSTLSLTANDSSAESKTVQTRHCSLMLRIRRQR